MGWRIRRNLHGKYEAVYTIFGICTGYGLIDYPMFDFTEFESVEEAKKALNKARERKAKSVYVWKE